MRTEDTGHTVDKASVYDRYDHGRVIVRKSKFSQPSIGLRVHLRLKGLPDHIQRSCWLTSNWNIQHVKNLVSSLLLDATIMQRHF